jgi:hypothetical protein
VLARDLYASAPGPIDERLVASTKR